jgi:RNA polymerase sigma-70 factor, ECF subfamily
MHSARSLPPTGHHRSNHPLSKRPPQLALVPKNGHAPALQVLHCQPLQAQGKYLQFQSFDDEYLRRLRAGDAPVEEHFRRYFSALIQIKLRSRLRSPEAIEDIRQETFLRFFVALNDGKIQQPDRLGSFVNSTCNHVLLEHYRGASRDDSLDDDEEKDFPAKSIDPVGVISAQEMDKKVREILEQLPERDRRLLREVFLEERDKDDVCRDFGVDREYLRVLLHRAKQAFKALYLKNMGDHPPEFSPA